MKKLPVKMGRIESILGILYIVAQIFVLPVILQVGNSLLPRPFNYGQLNFISFALNFICVTVIFHRYLLESFKIVFSRIGRFFGYYGLGFLFYWLGTLAVNILILTVDPEFSNVNDDSIGEITKNNFTLMAIGTVLLVPVVEETLYRGVIFGQLLRKNALSAYVLSVVLFSGIHVIGYIGAYRCGSVCALSNISPPPFFWHGPITNPVQSGRLF